MYFVLETYRSYYENHIMGRNMLIMIYQKRSLDSFKGILVASWCFINECHTSYVQLRGHNDDWSFSSGYNIKIIRLYIVMDFAGLSVLLYIDFLQWAYTVLESPYDRSNYFSYAVVTDTVSDP